VEWGAGLPVLNYRDAILPLAWVGAMLDRSTQTAINGDSLQVIVFSEGKRQVGLVVDQIRDIVEEAVRVKRACSSFGLLGSGVVGGKITDFVDLGALLDEATGNRQEAFCSNTKVGSVLLLVDPSKISRGVLRGYLEMNGHQIVEAAHAEEALEALSRHPIEIVISGLGGAGAGNFLDALRNQEALSRIPTLLLADPSDETSLETRRGRRFDGLVARGDREGMLRAIEALSGSARLGELAIAGSGK
jgi:two-component system chemotaxis sensor kinase CheA